MQLAAKAAAKVAEMEAKGEVQETQVQVGGVDFVDFVDGLGLNFELGVECFVF